MPRLLIGLGVVLVILTVYSLVDCALFDRNRIRGLPRWVWIFVILLVPVIGSILWLLVGRGRRAASAGQPGRSFAPDDDPDFLKGLDRRKSQEERIRQLEQELADLDKPDPRGGNTGAAGKPGMPPKKTDPGEGEQPGRRDA
jgi:hypothetical protein